MKKIFGVVLCLCAVALAGFDPPVRYMETFEGFALGKSQSETVTLGSTTVEFSGKRGPFVVVDTLSHGQVIVPHKVASSINVAFDPPVSMVGVTMIDTCNASPSMDVCFVDGACVTIPSMTDCGDSVHWGYGVADRPIGYIVLSGGQFDALVIVE